MNSEISHPAAAICPCGSGEPYEICCRNLHEGLAAETPEALMRSRYVAFIRNLPDYLLQTWHPSIKLATVI